METKCRSSVAPPYVKSDYNGGPSHQYYNRPGIVDWLRETSTPYLLGTFKIGRSSQLLRLFRSCGRAGRIYWMSAGCYRVTVAIMQRLVTDTPIGQTACSSSSASAPPPTTGTALTYYMHIFVNIQYFSVIFCN